MGQAQAQSNLFSISNMGRHNTRWFRLQDGKLPESAILHARTCGAFGARFGGPSGLHAAVEYERVDPWL